MFKQVRKRPPALTFEQVKRIIQDLSQKFGFQPIALDLLTDYVNSKRKSSLFDRKLHILKRFGLIDYIKGKNIQITDLGKQIVDPDTEKSNDAIHQSNLKFDFVGELWSKYNGNIPDDDTFKHVLLTDYRITPQDIIGWQDFIRASFRALKMSVEYKEQEVQNNKLPKSEELKSDMQPSQQLNETQYFDMKIPVSSGLVARIQIPLNATDDDKEMIKQIIDASKLKSKK